MALLRSQVSALFKYDRITTTVTRAKEVRKLADKMITLAKKNDLAAKRQILSFIPDKVVAKGIWSSSERFAKRSGGYTRIIQIGQRAGDAAPMVMLEFVDIRA